MLGISVPQLVADHHVDLFFFASLYKGDRANAAVLKETAVPQIFPHFDRNSPEPSNTGTDALLLSNKSCVSCTVPLTALKPMSSVCTSAGSPFSSARPEITETNCGVV